MTDVEEIGEEVSEKLVIIPEQVIVYRYHRIFPNSSSRAHVLRVFVKNLVLQQFMI